MNAINTFQFQVTDLPGHKKILVHIISLLDLTTLEGTNNSERINNFNETGVMIGVKTAGGISTPDQVLLYYLLVMNFTGDSWLNRSLFRIGAIRLADVILAELSA